MDQVLGHILIHVISLGTLKGLTLHNHTPLTDQQFLDDNFLMRHPFIQEAHKFHDILTTFSKSSGMALNLEVLNLFL